ncbi:hypothetical protein ATO13_23821 [Stappia sp. 22II-S9-Z10]|nr:hypothetical protein ATO13_23821 [Stappia sp. 22II-S9-Z10]
MPTQDRQALEVFAKRLNEAMVSKGWSQSDLARQASRFLADGKTFHRDNISKYVRAISAPGPVHLSAMARALGMQPNDLLSDTNVPSIQSSQSIVVQGDVDGEGLAWLKIDRPVSWETAMEVMRLLREDATRGKSDDV